MPSTGPATLQMDLDATETERLLQWLLEEASSVQRCYFLTRLGRLGPRPLGAALFSALLAADRAEDALRLVRHAAAALMPEAEMEELAREQLVARQVRCAEFFTYSALPCHLHSSHPAAASSGPGHAVLASIPLLRSASQSLQCNQHRRCSFPPHCCRRPTSRFPAGPARPGRRWRCSTPPWGCGSCRSCGPRSGTAAS